MFQGFFKTPQKEHKICGKKDNNSYKIYLFTNYNIYIYINIEDFSFQIKFISFPSLDDYRRSFRTFGLHQYCANYK